MDRRRSLIAYSIYHGIIVERKEALIDLYSSHWESLNLEVIPLLFSVALENYDEEIWKKLVVMTAKRHSSLITDLLFTLVSKGNNSTLEATLSSDVPFQFSLPRLILALAARNNEYGLQLLIQYPENFTPERDETADREFIKQAYRWAINNGNAQIINIISALGYLPTAESFLAILDSNHSPQLQIELLKVQLDSGLDIFQHYHDRSLYDSLLISSAPEIVTWMIEYLAV